MVPPVTRDPRNNDEGEASEDIGQNGVFRRRKVRNASEPMNEENKDPRYLQCKKYSLNTTFSKKFNSAPPLTFSMNF